MTLLNKLQILADGAKYDVSCASSGVDRNNKKGIGNSRSYGICHTWSSDGRCVSLLKILMTNRCIYDCAYCINRRNNDIPRASLAPGEIADLTIEFYRRNYIEGLFLSSAIENNPNETMEKIYKAISLLRNQYKFYGYIHVKAIPGADPILIHKTGELVDRMSVNIELPTEESLHLLAPQKNKKKIFLPMLQIHKGIQQKQEEKKKYRFVKKFVPGGQSTQMIVGATKDSDLSILKTTESLYQKYQLKRVYFSAYVPVNEGSNLPAIVAAPPIKREHRLYQADWLLRYYRFQADELLSEGSPNFDLDFDPKITWAFQHMDKFPIEVNTAPYALLLRVPGIGVQSAQRIMKQRKFAVIQLQHLQKIGVVTKRARFFITCNGKYDNKTPFDVLSIKKELRPEPKYEQISLFQ